MKKSKILSFVMALSMSFAVGCSGTPVPSSAPSITVPAVKTKITVWYAISGASGEAFLAQVEEFNKSQDSIEVEASFSGSYADTATKVSAALMSNTIPEVALMAAGPLYTGAREDYTMTKLMDDPAFNIADFFEGTLEYSMYNGKICAIPYGISTPVFYCNKNILDTAGIDIEKNPPKNWEDVYDLSKEIKAKVTAPDTWAFDVSDQAWLFKTMLNQNGNDIVKAENGKTIPVFDDDNAVAVGTWWEKMVKEGLMAPSQHANAEKKFLSGNLAFIVATSNRISRWNVEAGIDLGAVEMPYFQKQSVALGGNMLIMFPKDAEKDAASWELLKFLSSAEKQTDFALRTGYLPVRKSGLNLPVAKEALANNPLYKIAFDQMAYSWAYWNFNEMGTMDFIIRDAIDQIETGVNNPADALRDAVNNLIKEIE